MVSNVVMSSSASCEKMLNGLGRGKISVFSSDESSTTNGFMIQKNGDDDSFILDIDSFSQRDDITPNNSRFTLQKSLSRKGVEKDIIVTTCSPRAGNRTPVSPSPVVMPVGPVNPNQHQITITSGNNSDNAENKWGLRRNSFRRSSSSLGFDPRRILLFFATLSSMGTMILIYFTLSMKKLNDGDGTLN